MGVPTLHLQEVTDTDGLFYSPIGNQDRILLGHLTNGGFGFFAEDLKKIQFLAKNHAWLVHIQHLPQVTNEHVAA